MATTESPVHKKLLGEILIERKRITREQLDEALRFQKKHKGLLGEILVRLGYLDEKDIVVALVVQCDLPYIAINKYSIPLEILKLVPKETARELHVIPLDRVGNILSLVMVNPFDQSVKEEIERLSGCKVATFIATRTEIDEAIARWYGQNQ
jgi:type IV pilus assembly protein PilB